MSSSTTGVELDLSSAAQIYIYESCWL